MLKDLLLKALTETTGAKDVNLEFPENEEFGDYTTNVALILAKKKNKNPRELAQEIVEKLQKDKELAKVVEKIKVAGAGFINFWLKKEVFIDILVSINSQKDIFGGNKLMNGKRLMIEFAHPNTHKLFHIGHLRNITIGESLCRILSFSGAKIVKSNYQGDVGMHIAKALWGINKLGFKDPGDVLSRMEFLGKAYAKGSQAYEEDEKAKDDINKINNSIYDKSDEEINKIYKVTREWSLEYFDSIYKRVYTKFDRLYFESEVYETGKEKALEAYKKGILEKSDGALIFPGKKYGLHDRVFITSKDIPTYEAKDLGLAELQFSEFHPDLIIHLVGPEQSGYFEVIFKALELTNPGTKGRERHLPYGWVRLKKGKMASRLGNVVTAEWLLDEAKKRICVSYKTEPDIAEMVAVGAVKYSFLKVGLNQEIAFDIDESISLEGNSGAYLQYTYARTNSVLKKSIKEFVKIDKSRGIELNVEELLVLRTLPRFSEVIIAVAKTYSPNLLCNYLFDLAQKYNVFYNKHRIIDSDNKEFRLELTRAVGQVLKNGLNLLGIVTPEKM